MKGWKVLLGLTAAAGAADYGIANYFFKRTILRQNADTQRTTDMAGTDWEGYMPMIKERKAWMEEQPHEDVFIRSDDGLKLHATYFPGGLGKRIVICFHGYTGKGMSDFASLSKYYLTKGYRMLLVDERAHGESEGEYIGFGCLDRMDALRWIHYVLQLAGEDCEIWLHGISMGGATVLMTSGLKLPSQVKGIISDCAFTSAWDVFSHVLRSQYHLWPRPILAMSDKIVRKRAGYGLAQCSAAEEVKKTSVPILLIHGDADTFVPCRMCYEIYNSCPPPRDIFIVAGAGHAESYYKDTKGYEDRLTEFLEGQEG